MRVNLNIPDIMEKELTKIGKELGMNRQSVIMWFLTRGLVHFHQDEKQLMDYLKNNDPTEEC